MFWRKDRHTIGEFLVLGAVVAAACVGVLYGVYRGFKKSDVTPVPAAADDQAQPVLAAPAPEEYDTSAQEVMAPFLQQAASVTEASFDGDLSALGELVTKTEERLLRVRVPADRRDTHLSAVLLLGAWKRAIAGSVQDRKTVLSATATFAASASWATR